MQSKLACLEAALLLLLPGCITKTTVGNDRTVAGTVQVCSSCHGPGGHSPDPNFPRLAGQQKDYLVLQLRSFRDHTRADPHARTYMWGMAKTLDDATLTGVAAYFASEKPDRGAAADPALLAIAQPIVKDGIPARAVPACSACHGEHGEGSGEIPRLAGQYPRYLADQLRAFQVSARANAIMHENVHGLSQTEIDALAAYFGAL